MTYDVKNNKLSKSKIIALILMATSSLLYAIYFILFKTATANNNFVVITFWYQIGLLICGVMLFMFIKSYRHDFIELVVKNGRKVFAFNILNETLNLVANILVNFAMVAAPVAIVLTLNGFQPFFVFVIGALGTILIPRIFNEDISKSVIIHKLMCIIASFVGLAILYLL